MALKVTISDFNSIKVRLEHGLPYEKAAKALNFNSIKVRLELADEILQLCCCLFQFHKGAIRTHLISLFLNLILYFNSIKVRLELGFLIRK